MASLQTLCNQQQTLKSEMDRFIENSRKTAIAKRTQGFYETRIKGLQAMWAEFRHNHMAINNDPQANAEEYVTSNTYGVMEMKYYEYIGELVDGLRAQTPTPSSTPAPSIAPTTIVTTTSQQDIQLPRISLPKYNGNYDGWRSFHDIFVSLVHKNSKLQPVQKLHYLKECLTGDAESLLRHVPITNDDYEPAWTKLRERYENKRILVNHQLKTFMNMPKLATETAHGLKLLIDTTSECLQQLKSLEVDTTSWDTILIYVLVQRLPFSTLRLWEEELGPTQTLPSLATFRKFLNTRLRVLSSIADTIVPKSPAHVKTPAPQRVSYTHHARSTGCPACHAKHFIATCRKYHAMNTDARRKILQNNGNCLNCLASRHATKDCTSKYRCRKCNQKHHTTLHNNADQESPGLTTPKETTTQGDIIPSKSPGNTRVQTPDTTTKQSTLQGFLATKNHLHNGEIKPSHSPNYIEGQRPDVTNTQDTLQSFLGIKNHQALLATALVAVSANKGREKILRCLIDPGSESSFITTTACKQLGAQTTDTDVIITGLNVSPAATARKEVTLTLRARGGTTTPIVDDFLVLDTITDPLPTQTLRKTKWKHIQQLPLADPDFGRTGHIDMLIGVRLYTRIVQDGIRRGTDDAPVAINTLFGWILMGSTPTTCINKVTACTAISCALRLEEQLKRFWEIEEVPTTPMLSEEDKLCQQIFESTYIRHSNGKYQVTLPFIHNKSPTLGTSRPQALRRFAVLQQQFLKKPQLEEDYRRCLNEYIELGHMIPVDPPSNDETHYYIPHHAVFKDSTTTKLRVVFDASAKSSNGKSLNEQLLTGPTLQPKLYATLLNWRKFKIAMNADIEKMYRMIEVHPDHQTYQRIVWQHPHTQLLQDYKLKTVTFGTACAPFLAIRTLQQLAEDEKETWPLASQAIHNNFYVDDLLTGADTTQEAKQLQKELINITNAGGFKLRKWSSNEPALLATVPLEDKKLKTTLILNKDDAVKTLGIKWHPGPDFFTFNITPLRDHEVVTKRTILSDTASLYDPLGWVAPVIINAKILMQSLWITGFSWDQPVTAQIEQQWRNFKADLQGLNTLQIPRWINYSTPASMQLHGFCDASVRAYSAVVYLRVELDNGQVTSMLLTSKTRVAPTKPVTIPRLELNGAVILSRLLKATIENMQLGHIPICAWTDSMIALQWIKEHPSKWKTYVANRVVEIQETIRHDQWRYVPTSENPADLASRGVTVPQLINAELWWHGPSWLTDNTNEWPKTKLTDKPTNLEAKKTALTSVLAQLEDNILLRYSTMTRLTYIVALVQRFTFNCQNPKNKRSSYLSSAEWRESEKTIVRLVQQMDFSTDYNTLHSKKLLPPNSRLSKLSPFMDSDGLLRVGGRLANATITYSAKHPIILPQEHRITKLIIDQIHQATLHGGTSLVLATSRQKYWILDARRCITSQIRKCVTCIRHRGETMKQLMGHLPTPRVNISKPFANVGVDYAGPITIKTSTLRNAKLQKAYICVIVCLATRAVHLELVSDLSTMAFLAAFKRFVARRGLCKDIYSDCGTNFMGAKTTLDKDLKQAIKTASPEVAKHLASCQVTWHFNPPAAPHFGGMWEAGVKSVKHHLRRTLGNHTYTYEEYTTILTQVEACLNSRPLCYVRNDPEDPFVLTPGHFLICQPLNAIPEALDTDNLSVA